MAAPPSLKNPKTKDEWYEVLESWIPSWYFLDEDNQQDHLYGLARILSYNDDQVYQHTLQTFIQNAEGSILDEFGTSRGVERLPGELDAQYRIRIRNISFDGDCPTLKDLIDSILIVGESEIIEDFNATLFLNREQFYNRSAILVDQIENVFTILVDQQIHDPYSFTNREYFLGREDFMGTATTSDYVFELIQAIVDNNKATGTLYRVIERLGS